MNKDVKKMDMYKKRKIRAEKKNNDSQESLLKVSISWYIPTNVKPLTNPYK